MNERKIIEVALQTISFSILIYQLSDEDISDSLTYFTREKGLISKELFYDFLIATCVSNISDFLSYLKHRGIEIDKLNKLREEVVGNIIEVNPKLNPSKLVINNNNVVKIKTTRKKANETILVDNEHWGINSYDHSGKSSESSGKKLDMSKINNLKDLQYTKVQKFWRRFGRYLVIKQFQEGAEEIILSNKMFNTRTSFEQYIVTICVDEIEDLFLQLDKTGVPSRVSPHILIHELYDLCKTVNPTLDFDVYKESVGDIEEPTAIDPFEGIAQGEDDPETILNTAIKRQKKSFRALDKQILLDLKDNMEKKVIGQSKAIDNLVDAIQRASIGLKDPEQPIGSFIFTGFSGVGKSYTAKILAEELVGDRNALVTVDCSEYSADHEYAKLIGAPNGYIGHEHGGYLTNALKKNPFSIVLFDEIEKASEKVYQLLLQIMDEGRLTDGKGKKVSFKDAIIIMTSNLGVDETKRVEKTIGFGNASELTADKHEKAIKDSLDKTFKPEFLNRLTAIINFNTLSKSNYLKIIELELFKLLDYLKYNKTDYSNLNIVFDKSVYGYIYKRGIDAKLGARPLQRTIEREISTPLAKKILMEHIDSDTTGIIVKAFRNKIKFDTYELEIDPEDISKPPFYMHNSFKEQDE